MEGDGSVRLQVYSEQADTVSVYRIGRSCSLFKKVEKSFNTFRNLMIREMGKQLSSRNSNRIILLIGWRDENQRLPPTDIGFMADTVTVYSPKAKQCIGMQPRYLSTVWPG